MKNNNENLYSFEELISTGIKRKVNPFYIPTEFVENPIPTNFFNKNETQWARLPEEAIPDLTDEILVSDNGKVYNNTKEKIVSQYEDEHGYKRCKLPTSYGQTSKGIHRLILLAFDRIPDPAETKLVPNHVDGKKAHNELDNLEWATYRYNSIHAVETGLTSCAKLSVDDVKEICELLESDVYTSKQIADKFNCNDSNIRNIKSGIDWSQISNKYDIEVNPRIENDKIKEICEMLQTNQYTDTEIANKFNVSRGYVHDIRVGRRKSNIGNSYNMDKSDKRNPISDETVEKICKMLSENTYTESYIAKECNVSRPYVHNVATGKTRPDISSKYFVEYKVSEKKNHYDDSKIVEVCKLLEEKKYSDEQISRLTEVSRVYINNIKNHKYRTDISKNYDF